MTESAPCLGDGPEGGFALWLKAADGVRIRAVFWPNPEAEATVLVLPGRTEHAEKYGPTARRLAERGFASLAMDWRGQGLSQRLLDDRRVGHVGRFSDYQLDLRAVLDALGAQAGFPGPRAMIAHSMGGAIGLRAVLQGLPVCAAVFSAPMWGIKVPQGQERLTHLAAAAARHLGFGARYVPPPATGRICYLESAPFAGNVLTTDRASWDWMQGQLRARPDLALGGPSLHWLHEALTECRALRALPSPPVPCLTALGSREQVVDTAAVTERMARWPGSRLSLVEGAEHEILMEAPALRDGFLNDIAAHVRAHAGSGTSDITSRSF